MHRFEAEQIRTDIKTMSRIQLAALGAMQLKRMAPNFFQFARETGWRGVGRIQQVLGLGWHFVESDGFVSIPIDEAELLDSAPDTEDFSSLYTSSALDAVNSAASFVRFLSGSGADDIFEMMSLAIDSADVFVQLSNEGIDIEEIDGHEIVQREIVYQIDDIDFLKKDPEYVRILSRYLSYGDRKLGDI